MRRQRAAAACACADPSGGGDARIPLPGTAVANRGIGEGGRAGIRNGGFAVSLRSLLLVPLLLVASAAPAAKKSSSLPPLNGLASIVMLARIGDDLTRKVKLCTATAMAKTTTSAGRDCTVIFLLVPV